MSLKLINTETSQLVREVSRKMDALMLPLSDNNKLTVMKLKVLLEVNKKSCVNIGEIGQSLGVAGGNISNMCKTLEKEGYLKRTRSTEDERVVTVELTKLGNEVLTNVKSQVDSKYKDFKDDITDKKYDDIINSLQILNRYLDNLANFK